METVTIELPSELVSKLASRIEDTEFESIDEYTRFVLREIAEGDADQSAESTEVADHELQDRLEDLGYL